MKLRAKCAMSFALRLQKPLAFLRRWISSKASRLVGRRLRRVAPLPFAPLPSSANDLAHRDWRVVAQEAFCPVRA